MVTSILKKMTPQRPHLAGLVVLLGLTFVVTLSLSWAAWRYAGEARKQADNALLGWSEIVGSNFDGFTADNFNIVLGGTFGPLGTQIARRGAEVTAEEAGRLINPNPLVRELTRERVRFFFRIDLQTGALETYPADAVVPEPVREWLHSTTLSVPTAGFSPDGSRTFAYFTGHSGGEQRFIAFLRVGRPGGDESVAAYGFETDAGVLNDYFSFVWKNADLLPQARRANAVNDSILALTITDADGNAVFQSPIRYDTTYQTSLQTSPPFPGLTVHATINAALAGALIPEMPSSPIPLLFGLLVLTTMLMVSALFLIRRESELSRLRADFIAGVSHELRTPLAQIRMFAETLMLGRVRSDAERVRSLEIIDQEARRLSHLVENVLIFAKSERRKSHIETQMTDLPADVRDTIQGFAVLCRSRDIELRADLQENISAPVDRGALRQMLLNLLDNAVKYGPLRQRITVGMALFDSNVRIWVDDEGPGIPGPEREHVFGRFVRLPRDAEGATGGSGIGLAIVRELAELHGGRVWVDDAPGAGARVVFELPGAYVRPDASTGGWAVA